MSLTDSPHRTLNFSQLSRDYLAAHNEVRRLMFAAMMPGLSTEEIASIKRLEAQARQERKRLGVLIRDECRLRVDAWDGKRQYSSYPGAKQRAGRR
jgi:hypothetical protein